MADDQLSRAFAALDPKRRDMVARLAVGDATVGELADPYERFQGLGDGRARLRAQSLVDSFEGRDQWLASGMEAGVDEGHAKLDALVAALR